MHASKSFLFTLFILVLICCIWPVIKMLRHYQYWDGVSEPRGMHKQSCASYLARLHRPSICVQCKYEALLPLLFEFGSYLLQWPRIIMTDAQSWDGVSEPCDMHKYKACASYLAR